MVEVMNEKILMINIALLSVLFIVAPFHSQANIGGLGLNLPFNIAAWLAATLFISVTIIFSSRLRVLIYSRALVYCLIFPVVVIIAGFVSEVPQPTVWFFRQLYILGGFLFLFSLFQLRLSVKQIEQLLYILVLSTLLHSLVGVAQVFNLTELRGWIPIGNKRLPIGVFQQVNVQASYLVTGLGIILFLISRPSFNASKIVTTVLFILTIGMAVYVIISTGSRIGILSLIVMSSLMMLSRKKHLLRHKKIMLLIALVSVFSVIAGQSGLLRALDKTEKMTEGEYSSARKTMYAIGVDLVQNKPLFGYGIGSFPRVWTEQTAIFARDNPQAVLPYTTATHPHNEVLLWMIEGGLISVASLLVILIVFCMSLYFCGFSRGVAYLALLLPITLHTQVELPFYISSLHWFLWLFLIFIVLRHRTSTIKLKLSQMAKYSIQICTIVVGIGASAMLVHAEKAQKEIFHYIYIEGGGDIQVALNDLYFNTFAEKLMMQTVLYSSIKQNNKTKLPMFIDWAEHAIGINPELGMFILLSDAYGFMGDKSQQCRVAKRGISIYIQNDHLQTIVNNCTK
mgnify:CR=1 FL=1